MLVSEIRNRVERYNLTDDKLSNPKVILDDIKGQAHHDGGRLEFGPDKKLYITTGDTQQPDLAQDLSSPNGKILSINFDDSIPSNDPFGNAAYSYRHRNPQGLAWDNHDRLWATKHCSSGNETGNDEINLIKKGGQLWMAIYSEISKSTRDDYSCDKIRQSRNLGPISNSRH